MSRLFMVGPSFYHQIFLGLRLRISKQLTVFLFTRVLMFVFGPVICVSYCSVICISAIYVFVCVFVFDYIVCVRVYAYIYAVDVWWKGMCMMMCVCAV